MARLVLSDASPMIGLARVGGVDWLRSLFGKVELTPSVYRELQQGPELEPAIREGIEEGWLFLRASDPEGAERPPHLGHGEWATILAAKQYQGSVLALMDNRLARKDAKLAGIKVAGTAALIGMARSRNLIESAEIVFEKLLRSDFRVAPEVIRAVLERLK